MPRSLHPSAHRHAGTWLPIGRSGRDRVVLGGRVVWTLVLAVALAACRGGFRIERFAGDTGPLFKAGLAELSLRHWGNATAAFEKLTADLPARDSLLPLSHYYLGKARSGNAEHLLAAQSFNKVSENFPDDSLADDAMYESAHEYQLLWRSPELDSQYGVTAQAAYRTLVAVYPDSPRRKDAERELAKLEEMFATKEYLAGYYYYRRKAYDPAILYFKTVVNTFPETRRARDAYLRMIESYRVIRYVEEAADACVAVKKGFGDDPEVKKLCPPVAAPRDSASAKPAGPARDSASAKPAVPPRAP
jgi:outer membrane protein assembly factor BamD